MRKMAFNFEDSLNENFRMLKKEKIFIRKNDKYVFYGYEILGGKPSSICEDIGKFLYILGKIIKLSKSDVYYHINIYPKTLLLFFDILKEIHIPSNVIIELVEFNSSTPVDNIEKLVKSLNINISIDDFGTGSSNFCRLNLPNLSSVKFDRLLWNNNDLTNVVKEVNKIVLNKGIITIAEKVETEEELKRIENLGIIGVQGFITNTFKYPALIGT